MALFGVDPGGRDGDDGSLAKVDEPDVVAVEGLVVPLIDDRTLAAERMRRHQRGRRLRILDDAGDRLAVQLGGHPVGLDVEEDVAPVERAHHAALLDGAQPILSRRALDRRTDQHVQEHRERGQPGRADRVFPLRGPDLGVPRLELVELARFERPHLPRQCEGGRALEHDEFGCLLGDHRNQLHARGSRTDDADALAGEVVSVGGPPAGVERRSGERVHARDVGFQRHREDAGRGDDVRRDVGLARLGLERPCRHGLVERHRDDVRVEPDVGAKVQPVGHEVQVGLDLGLGGHRLRPHPLLLDLVGEAVRVLDALDVAAGAGVSVDQPRAPDVGGLLEDARAEPSFAQLVQHVQPGETRADDHHVESVVGVVGRHVASFASSRRPPYRKPYSMFMHSRVSARRSR